MGVEASLWGCGVSRAVDVIVIVCRNSKGEVAIQVDGLEPVGWCTRTRSHPCLRP